MWFISFRFLPCYVIVCLWLLNKIYISIGLSNHDASICDVYVPQMSSITLYTEHVLASKWMFQCSLAKFITVCMYHLVGCNDANNSTSTICNWIGGLLCAVTGVFYVFIFYFGQSQCIVIILFSSLHARTAVKANLIERFTNLANFQLISCSNRDTMWVIFTRQSCQIFHNKIARTKWIKN